MQPARAAAAVLAVLALIACSPAEPRRPDWVLVIHGGAGKLSPETLAANRDAFAGSLRSALHAGTAILSEGGSALDAVEEVLAVMEDDPSFNAGRGAVYTRDGRHELDAAIMNGSDHRTGAVTGVTTVRNPIRLARRVMEDSKHVLFAGPGAEAFADTTDLERVDNAWFGTDRRRKAWEEKFGTVGCLALDRAGNLAAGTSTGGMTGKRYGRVGDSPIVGAGTWADNRTCAVSCTGTGEEFIRYGIAQRVSDMMEYGRYSLQDAADEVVHRLLRPGDGGLIGLDGMGSVIMAYNTGGMLRGMAASDGRFEVALGDDPEPAP